MLFLEVQKVHSDAVTVCGLAMLDDIYYITRIRQLIIVN